jgi:hypothetical protein
MATFRLTCRVIAASSGPISFPYRDGIFMLDVKRGLPGYVEASYRSYTRNDSCSDDPEDRA